MLVFNGVPPTEWTAEFCSRAAKSAAKRGIAVAADCGGGALAAITEAVRPVLIKRNAAELETAAGAAPTGFSDIAGAARALNRGGARYVFAHLGGDGVIAVGGGAAYSAQYAHDLPKSGPDAGGDAMFAAACGTIVSGGGILEALSAAAAAATAAALAAPSGEADAELFGKIRKNIRITAL
jgi:fructose-1-phosphate kinase PfkB-like protein